MLSGELLTTGHWNASICRMLLESKETGSRLIRSVSERFSHRKKPSMSLFFHGISGNFWKVLWGNICRKQKKENFTEASVYDRYPASEMKHVLQSEEMGADSGSDRCYIEDEDGFILIDYKTDQCSKRGSRWRKKY